MNGVGQRQNYLYQEHRISAENNLDVSSTPHMAPMRSDRNTVTNTSLIE